MNRKEYEMKLVRFVKHEPFETSDGNLVNTGTGYFQPKGSKGKSAVKLSVVFLMPNGFKKENLSRMFVRFEKKVKKKKVGRE